MPGANVLLINTHQPYPFSEGRLSASLVALAAETLQERGYTVRQSAVAEGWDVEEAVTLHQWADVIVLQLPVNWMGVSWRFKKYMDEVYTAGMDGRLCVGDGRRGPGEDHRYGLGGSLDETRYMLSLSFNAPAGSFLGAGGFFEGKSVDDLFWPMHLNAKFFGMRPLETFSCHDVMKNPDVEEDLRRFRAHLERVFPVIS